MKTNANVTLAGGGLTLSKNKNKDRKKFSQEQLNMLKEKNLLTFVTASANGVPHAIIIEPTLFEEDRIVIPMVQMETTRDNLKENPNCYLHCYIEKGLQDSIQLKITGYGKVTKRGKLFDEVYKIEDARLPENLEVFGVIEFYPTDIKEFIG